jgi:hypothetical protein
MTANLTRAAIRPSRLDIVNRQDSHPRAAATDDFDWSRAPVAVWAASGR